MAANFNAATTAAGRASITNLLFNTLLIFTGDNAGDLGCGGLLLLVPGHPPRPRGGSLI